MTVTKNQVNGYLQKLYRFLDEGHSINFKKMRNYVGEITTPPYIPLNEGKAQITLDHRAEVFATLIHETLHRFHPYESEEWILEREKHIVNKLTNRQIKNIIKRWGRCM